MNFQPHPASLSTFKWRETPAQIDWGDMHLAKNISAASAKKIQLERARGVNSGAIHGLSRKADERMASFKGAYVRKGPKSAARSQNSDTERLRAALKAGPLTCAQLAAAAGVDAGRVQGLLKYDRALGRVLLAKVAKPYLWSLAEGARA